MELFKENNRFTERVKIVYPLFGLKWCMIFLNEFLADDFSRRAFAAVGPLDRKRVRREQLQKARNLYQHIKEAYAEFPYAVR